MAALPLAGRLAGVPPAGIGELSGSSVGVIGEGGCRSVRLASAVVFVVCGSVASAEDCAGVVVGFPW